MKTLIVYTGKYGFTKQCVEDIASALKGAVDVVELNIPTNIDLTNYNQVIIGGAIYMGKVHKNITTFVHNNLEILRNKRIGLFITCGFSENFDMYLRETYPERLLAIALTKRCFGGELQISKMKFFDKMLTIMMIYMRNKEHASLPHKQTNQIDLFIKALTIL